MNSAQGRIERLIKANKAYTHINEADATCGDVIFLCDRIAFLERRLASAETKIRELKLQLGKNDDHF